MNAALKIGAGLVLGLLALRLLVVLLEPRLAFYPQRDLVRSPRDAGLPYEQVMVTTADGLGLAGWFVPAPDGSGTAAGPGAGTPAAPLLLVFHGNAETIAHGLDLAARARRAGFAVLLAEYRGYGGNPGSPGEAGLMRDGRAFADAAAARTHGGPLILWGRSIGAAVAARLAVEGRGDLLILESPFTSARALLRDDGAWLFWALSYLGSYRFDTASLMPRIRVPVLVIHGTRDDIAPFAHGRRLHDLAPGPKALLALQGGGHNDLWVRHGDALWNGALRFVRDHAGGAAPRPADEPAPPPADAPALPPASAPGAPPSGGPAAAADQEG